MPTYEMICLANSSRRDEIRKQPGRCLAGLRVDGQGWLRPVSEAGALSWEYGFYEDGDEIRPLDVVAVSVTKPVPEPWQPENWLVGNERPRMRTRPAPPDKYAQVLRGEIEEGPELLGGTGETLSEEEAVLQRSFCLLRPPADLRFFRREVPWRRTPQCRTAFSLGDIGYDLAVTDIACREALQRVKVGEFVSSAQVGYLDPLLMTVSLGTPYRGNCYKLLAAMIKRPLLWQGVTL